jgi:hypothetical protein
MRVFAAVALTAATTIACAQGGLFRQYEYEEDMYLSLDGSATVYVNSSIAALNTLHGASFDARPNALVDRAAVRAYYEAPGTHVDWVRTSRRSGRQFVHVRLDVDDVRALGAAAPFKWSTYRFGREDNLYIYQQAIGAPARSDPGNAGWDGREIVAFRLHPPSKIAYHNTGTGVRRGNILVWEQPLSERLRGVPLVLDARMETQSILYRTLWVFGATALAVAATFVVVIGWVLRRPGQRSSV